MRKSNKGSTPVHGGHRKDNKGPKIKNRQPRAPMLNMRKVADFRYDIRQVLTHSKMDESVCPSFIAQVVAKASRMGIKDAKSYVKEFCERGDCSKGVSDEICNLLDHYTKYR